MRARRGALAALVALVAAAWIALGLRAAPLRAVDPLPLPTIDLGTPLPTIDLGTPLPTGSASPSGSPSTPSRPAEPTVRPRESAPAPSPSSSLDELLMPRSDRSPPLRDGAIVPGADGPGPGLPGIPDLPPVIPTLPDAGSWLIPVAGVAVPALLVALVVAGQVVGGAAGLRLARTALGRMASAAPPWTRS